MSDKTRLGVGREEKCNILFFRLLAQNELLFFSYLGFSAVFLKGFSKINSLKGLQETFTLCSLPHPQRGWLLGHGMCVGKWHSHHVYVRCNINCSLCYVNRWVRAEESCICYLWLSHLFFSSLWLLWEVREPFFVGYLLASCLWDSEFQPWMSWAWQVTNGAIVKLIMSDRPIAPIRSTGCASSY